jgi:probable phosphoglycerate mutase
MSASTELWLVRHGETTLNASRRLAGWSDPPLTETGRRQAVALRELLDGRHFDRVWSSDLERAVTTAKLAWGEPQPDDRLREINFGDLEGLSYDEVDLAFAGLFLEFRDFQIPGGESHDEFRGRVRRFVDTLAPGRHLLFVHGGVVRILTQDLGLDRFVNTAAVVGMDWTDRRILFIRESERP